MEFSGSFDQFEVTFSPPISTPPDLWKLTKTSVKLCIVFFKSQTQWPKDVSRGIGEVHGVGVRQGGMESLYASSKGALEVRLEKSLQPLFTHHGG